jgi:membrane-associated phospholipid phosphatase
LRKEINKREIAKMTWKEAFVNKKSILEIIITIIILSFVLWSLANFLSFVESRRGVILPDPVLSLFKPVDLTWLIFGLIYLCLIIAVIEIAKHPDELLFVFQAYSLLLLFRIAAMYTLPLDPPLGMIPLNDPFVQFFGTGKLLTKDLFFSGHTATLFLLFLAVKKEPLKIIFLICSSAVGISVLLQHVHYTIDVLAAPFFAYTSVRIITVIKQ